MRVKLLIEHLQRFKDDVEVTIESPVNQYHCYPVVTVSQAEHHGRPVLIFSSDEKVKGVCHRCEEARSRGTMTYDLDYLKDEQPRRILFDVSAAYAWARTHPELIHEIPEKDANEMVLVNLSETFCGAHVAHVDTDSPALIGTHGEMWILLDGTHRIMSRLKAGRPPIAYVLDEKQTMNFVMLDGPR